MDRNVKVSAIVEKMNLKNLTPEVDYSEKIVEVPDINRPALQLTGYFEHFDAERIQVIGFVEYTYLQKMPEDEKERIYSMLLSYKLPGIVYSRSQMPDAMMLEKAAAASIPVFQSEMKTSQFTAELIRWLNVELAPCISIHGVLVDVYGVGVLIMGESGIGKSEASLELIRRGHRLVTDDVVEIRKINNNTLIGTSPDITRYFIELRGIGIIDVKTLFGVECVKEQQTIDLVIKLEDWKKDKEYDRLGLEEEYTEFLGNKFWAIILSAIPSQSVRDEIWLLSVRRQQQTTGRRKWVITQRKSCIAE